MTNSYQYDILISINYTQTVSKIRERGQLTIPQSVRSALNWSGDEVMVKVTTIQNGFRVERLPISHPQSEQRKLTKRQWDEIWQDLEKISRSGRQDISLKEFVRHDRDTRE